MDLRLWSQQGDLHALQTRHAAKPFTVAGARADDNYAFRWACENGHLAVAQWLTATFGLGAADARADNDDALIRAHFNGHPELARWLTALGEYTREELAALLGEDAVAKLGAEPEEETLMVKPAV